MSHESDLYIQIHSPGEVSGKEHEDRIQRVKGLILSARQFANVQEVTENGKEIFIVFEEKKVPVGVPIAKKATGEIKPTGKFREEF